MLSRVAERIYWTARYLERAEDTARLVNVYASLMLDSPRGVGLEWRQLIDISGNNELYSKHYNTYGEQRVTRFMVAERVNPSSIFSSIASARENMRTTRDVVPTEAWEHVNELYLFAKKRFAQRGQRKRLFHVLSEVVMRCQQIAGLLAGTMSHGDAYQFVRLGRNLERADMTTRILDVASATLIAPGSELGRLENRLWIGILKILSGMQMYRQTVRRRVTGPPAAAFLLHDQRFPRSVAFCLRNMRECAKQLPRNQKVSKAVAVLADDINTIDVVRLIENNGLQQLMDNIQLELAKVHDLIATTWFARAKA